MIDGYLSGLYGSSDSDTSPIRGFVDPRLLGSLFLHYDYKIRNFCLQFLYLSADAFCFKMAVSVDKNVVK